MNSRSVQCPSCGAPTSAKESEKTVVCEFCNNQFENPVYKPMAQAEPQRDPLPASAPRKTNRYRNYILITVGVFVVAQVIGLAMYFSSRDSSIEDSATEEAALDNAESLEPKEPPLSPEVLLERKLKGYIICLSESSLDAKDSMDRYDGWVDLEKGPNCKRSVILGIYRMHKEAENCKKHIAAADALEPALPEIENAAREYYATVAAMQSIVNELDSYYDDDKYKVDDCMKGEALHPELLKAYENLKTKSRPLQELLEKKMKGTLDRCLEQTSNDPQLVAEHQYANIINLAGKLLEAFRVEMEKSQPDANVFKKHISILNEAAATLKAMSRQQLQKLGLAYGMGGRWIDEFVKRGAMEFLETKKPKRLKGRFEYMVERYNSGLEIYNSRLKQCGGLLPCNNERCPIH